MGPFMKNDNSTNKMMCRVLIALLPIVLFSFYKNGVLCYDGDLITLFKPLMFIGLSTLFTFIIETTYLYIFTDNKLKDIIKNNYAYMPGLFLGLILPINTPISILLVGCFISTIIGKMLFGGFGKNIFNPALIGRLFVISMYALTITNLGGYLNSNEIDAVTSATPLSNMNVIEGIGTYEELVKPYGTLKDFFLGFIPGCIGETSSVLIILAFIYLSLTKTIKWRIPAIYVATVFIMTFFIGSMNGVGLWYPVFQILSGGLLFGAVFMATDPVTSPTTKYGQIIYGLCLGILTVTLRYLTSYPEGVLTSILTMNMLVFIIDDIGVKIKFNKRKIIIPLTVLMIISISLIFVIGNKFKVSQIDTKFEILSSNMSNNIVTYNVSEVGYSSKIKLEIKIKDGEILSINVLEQNDSFFSKVLNSNYLDTLVNNQKELDTCDTVSGATISSTAVKKAVINTLNDYKVNYEK